MELVEARRITQAHVEAVGIEKIELDMSLGRVLGEAVIATSDLPGETRSRFDGFAVRSSDTAGAKPDKPVALLLLPGVLAAGYDVRQKLGAGESIKILTGAPLPIGADAVVPYEKTATEDDNLILTEELIASSGVKLSGQDIRANERVLAKGEVLTPTRLALIAALGVNHVRVYHRPQVALLATGDEVKETGEEITGPWTYCNNRRLLGWLAALQGCSVSHLGVAKDDPQVIASSLDEVQSDVVISTGGMGQGDRDFVQEAWKILGIKSHFDFINLSPGKRSAFGTRGKQMFWGLSGNPWAAQIVFQELITPVLRRLQGQEGAKPYVLASLKRRLLKKRGLYQAVRGAVDLRAVPPSFIPIDCTRASAFSGMAANFAYILLDVDVVEVTAGSLVQVYLHDFPLVATPLFETADYAKDDADGSSGL